MTAREREGLGSIVTAAIVTALITSLVAFAAAKIDDSFSQPAYNQQLMGLHIGLSKTGEIWVLYVPRSKNECLIFLAGDEGFICPGNEIVATGDGSLFANLECANTGNRAGASLAFGKGNRKIATYTNANNQSAEVNMEHTH